MGLFSKKVEFLYKKVKLVGRVCEELENGDCLVITTGEHGNLYQVHKDKLTLVVPDRPYLEGLE